MRHHGLRCRHPVPYVDRNLFARTQIALGMTQEELGVVFGVSKRTAQRYARGGVTITPHQLFDLIRLVHPRSPELAAMLAELVGGTPESLGVVPRPSPVDSPATRGPTASLPRIVDSVVLAAADAMNLPPREARAGLHAAFTRAEELGLTVEAIAGVLRDALPPPAAPVPRERKERNAAERDAK